MRNRDIREWCSQARFIPLREVALTTFGGSEGSVPVPSPSFFYGIWGDSTATTDGTHPSVGEVSLSLATACYGKGMSAGTGSGTNHDAEDVLYIAFTGADAVPGGVDGGELRRVP